MLESIRSTSIRDGIRIAVCCSVSIISVLILVLSVAIMSAAAAAAAASESQDDTAKAATADATEGDTVETKNRSNNSSSSSSSVPAAKVKVHFVAVGRAPIMKKTKFQIGADQKFASVHAFLRRILKLSSNNSSSSSSLFLYCSSAFVPGPDELLGDLRDCFSVRDELVIHYSLEEAWG